MDYLTSEITSAFGDVYISCALSGANVCDVDSTPPFGAIRVGTDYSIFYVGTVEDAAASAAFSIESSTKKLVVDTTAPVTSDVSSVPPAKGKDKVKKLKSTTKKKHKPYSVPTVQGELPEKILASPMQE